MKAVATKPRQLPKDSRRMRFLSIDARLALIVGLLIVTVVGLIVGESWSFRESMLQERRTKIFDINTSVVAIVKRHDALVASGKMTLPEAQEAVKTAVVNKRAGGMGLISGRKAFQRPMADGVKLLNLIQDIYLDKAITIA